MFLFIDQYCLFVIQYRQAETILFCKEQTFIQCFSPTRTPLNIIIRQSNHLGILAAGVAIAWYGTATERVRPRPRGIRPFDFDCSFQQHNVWYA